MGSSNFLIDLNPAYIVAKFELAKYVEVKLARISDRAIRQIVNFGGYPQGREGDLQGDVKFF